MAPTRGSALKVSSPKTVPRVPPPPETFCFGGGKDRWRPASKIKAGAFGTVYAGEQQRGEEEPLQRADGEGEGALRVAIKVESTAKDQRYMPQLLFEARLLRHLAGHGIPQVLWSGSRAPYNAVVMELLGQDLDAFRKQLPGGRCPAGAAARAIGQILSRLQWVHQHGYIHCDVKPANCCAGLGAAAGTLYLCDFGIAKRAHAAGKGKRVPAGPEEPKDSAKLRGTPRYKSVSAHELQPLSQWDDIESTAYTLMELLAGDLPWDKALLAAPKKRDGKLQDPIHQKKLRPPAKLCAGLPAGAERFLAAARASHTLPPSADDFHNLREALQAVEEEADGDPPGCHAFIERHPPAAAAPRHRDPGDVVSVVGMDREQAEAEQVEAAAISTTADSVAIASPPGPSADQPYLPLRRCPGSVESLEDLSQAA